MRFMMFVRANDQTETGVMPSEEELAQMAVFNEELVNAGVMLAGDGLHPSAKGVLVHYEGEKRTVVDGPFTEAKELVAGYWMIQVRSKEEAVEWARRVPFTSGAVELRQVFEFEDFEQGEAIEHHRRLADRMQDPG